MVFHCSYHWHFTVLTIDISLCLPFHFTVLTIGLPLGDTCLGVFPWWKLSRECVSFSQLLYFYRPLEASGNWVHYSVGILPPCQSLIGWQPLMGWAGLSLDVMSPFHCRVPDNLTIHKTVTFILWSRALNGSELAKSRFANWSQL